METVEINILGISGTDIKDGNCDTLVKEALKGADEIGEEVGGVETEFVTLADKEIVRCKHCQWCIKNRAPCKVQDDFYVVYEKLKKCDGFILGAPSWFRTCGPRLMEFWSRLRFSVFFSNELRNKVGGAVSLGFFGYGVENTLDVLQGFAAIGEIFVARDSAMASTVAFGQRPAYLEHGVLDDIQGIHRVRMVGKKVAEGVDPQEYLGNQRSVAEGFFTSAAGWELSRKLEVDMPITDHVFHVLHRGRPLREAVDLLLTRESKEELTGIRDQSPQ